MIAVFLVALATIKTCTSTIAAQVPAQPLATADDFANRKYFGRVSAVTKDSITIESPESTHRTYKKRSDGVARWEDEVVPAMPPKRFEASETLAAGEIPRMPRGADKNGRGYFVPDDFMYRLTDVKYGDWVHVLYSRVGGVDTCDHIRIVKRPGGRVPPLPPGVDVPLREKLKLPANFPVPEWVPYHERMNAHWDKVDKDNPHPEKLGNLPPLPPGWGLTIAPAPRLARPRVVAPAPREVTSPGKRPSGPSR